MSDKSDRSAMSGISDPSSFRSAAAGKAPHQTLMHPRSAFQYRGAQSSARVRSTGAAHQLSLTLFILGTLHTFEHDKLPDLRTIHLVLDARFGTENNIVRRGAHQKSLFSGAAVENELTV